LNSPGRTSFITVLAGIILTAGQVLIIRRTLALTGGDEIVFSLALFTWLVSSASGSYLSSRFLKTRLSHTHLLQILLILLSLAVPASLLSLHYVSRVTGWITGTLPGAGALFLPIVFAVSPLAVIAGSLFPLLCQSAQINSNEPVTHTYLYEAAGALIAGLALSLLFWPGLTGFTVAFFLCILGIAAALTVHRQKIVLWLPLLLAAGITLLAFNFTCEIDRYLFELLQPGIEVTELQETPYGMIEYSQYEGQTQIKENSLPVMVSEDLPEAEEKSLLFLAQHPNPESVLWIGGALGSGTEQALRDTSIEKLDIVELNPALLEAREKLPVKVQDKVDYHIGDGRSFIRQSPPETYDLIILQLPGPRTLRLAKYYTVSFFREASRALKSSGLLGFTVQSPGDYTGKESAALLKSIKNTLEAVFKHVALLPGQNVIFLAGMSDFKPALTAEEITARLRNRGIELLYWDFYRLRDRLSPSRYESMLSALEESPSGSLNTDTKPSSFFLNQIIIARQMRSGLADIMGHIRNRFPLVALYFLVVVTLLALVLMTGRKISNSLASNWTVMTAGFSGIALEILCLIGYQVHYGSGYREVGILVGLYMAGLALSGIITLKISRLRQTSSRIIQAILIVLSLVFLALFIKMPELIEKSPAIGRGFYFIFMLSVGLVTGLQFLLMTRLKSSGKIEPSGILYALDLTGAAFGAVFVGLFAIPITGIWWTTIGLVWLNLLPLFLLLALPLKAAGSQS